MSGHDVFTAPGRFFRGNIHTHSTRSDGVLEPLAVCERYARSGYDFLCLSDHFLARFGFPVTDVACELRESGSALTVLLGAELHAPQNSHGELWHVLACGLPADFAATGESEDALALVTRAKQAGAFVGIAHPQWSSLTIEDGRQMAAVADAVEIYNTGCDLETDRADGTALWDALLNEGFALTGYAADDAHFRIDDHAGGWMMLKAENGDRETLLAAMKAGRFYSTCGPTIEAIEIDGDHLRVASSPARNIALVGRGSRAENLYGEALTEARLSTERFAGDWLRVVVTDAAGRSAWSNPIRL